MISPNVFYIIDGGGKIVHDEVFTSKRKATEILKYYVSEKNKLCILVGLD